MTRTHSHTYRHSCTQRYTFTHKNNHTEIYTSTRKHIQTHMHITHIDTHTDTYSLRCTHPHLETYPHTDTHIHTQTLILPLSVSFPFSLYLTLFLSCKRLSQSGSLLPEATDSDRRLGTAWQVLALWSLTALNPAPGPSVVNQFCILS